MYKHQLSYYDYDSSFRFALTDSHEELSNIIQNKLWYIKNKNDLINLLDICFKEDDIPLKTIDMIFKASSYKPLTLLKQLNQPFWSCMIHHQEDKFEFLLQHGFFHYQYHKSLITALIEFNHLDLFKLASNYSSKLSIEKESIEALLRSQFENCIVSDYTNVICEKYSLKNLKKIVQFAQEIDDKYYDYDTARAQKFIERKETLIINLETFLLENTKNYAIIKHNQPAPKKLKI